MEKKALESNLNEMENNLKECEDRGNRQLQQFKIEEKRVSKSKTIEEISEYNRLIQENQAIKQQELSMEIRIAEFLREMTELMTKKKKVQHRKKNHKLSQN